MVTEGDRRAHVTMITVEREMPVSGHGRGQMGSCYNDHSGEGDASVWARKGTDGLMLQ